jgi:hypothetical protein
VTISLDGGQTWAEPILFVWFNITDMWVLFMGDLLVFLW